MELAGKTIAVTGASGMLGVYLCRALLGAGARVRAVVRNPDKAAFLGGEGAMFAKADLNDRGALTEAFRGADAVIANAALYSVTNMKWKDNHDANKTGTENQYEAMAAARVPRAVHISTFGVYRWHTGKPAITDTDATIDGEKREGGAYRATKQLSEALAFSLSRRHGIATTAVRPAGIYGARDSNLVPYVRGLLKLPLFPAPRFGFLFVYAGDVANAVVGALRNDASSDQPYLIAGLNTTPYDLICAARDARGGKNWVAPLPTGTGIFVDCSKAAREIGFANRPLVDGWREVFSLDAK